MEQPPFNFPNPLGYFGGTKQVSNKSNFLLFDYIHVNIHTSM